MKNSFVENLHKGFNTPVSLIREWIRKYTHQDIAEITKIVKWYANEVYSINTNKNNVIIIKINHYGNVWFNREVWAMEQAKLKWVPVAKVYFHWEDNLGNEQKNIIIQEKIKWYPLDEIIWSISKKKLEMILCEAWEILSKIHSIDVEWFYWKNLDWSWHHQDWVELMELTMQNRKKDTLFYKELGLTSKDIKMIFKSLELLKSNSELNYPVLCHGDYTPEHIIVDENLKISGIIDFWSFQWWAPIKDFAIFSFLNPNINLYNLVKWYIKNKQISEDFDFYLQISKVEYILPLIKIYQNLGDVEQSEYAKNQLFDTLNQLKKYSIFSHKMLIYDS